MRTIQDLRRDEKDTQSLRSRSGVIFFFLLILIISGIFKILQLTVLDRVKDDTEDLCKVETLPKFEGRQMVMVLAPK